MKHCKNCGEVVSLKVPEMDNRERHVCDSCETIHYHNPKPVVGILPVFEGKVLLCKRAINPQYGKWTLPCGFMENGESLEKGALREAMEEVGISPTLGHLHTIFSLPQIGQVYFVFWGALESTDFKIGIETLDAAFFEPESIPWEDLAFESMEFCLRHFVDDVKTGQMRLHSSHEMDTFGVHI